MVIMSFGHNILFVTNSALFIFTFNILEKQYSGDFVLSWVSDPEWKDSYFEQKLEVSDKVGCLHEGKWITRGRLEQLLGEQEVLCIIFTK